MAVEVYEFVKTGTANSVQLPVARGAPSVKHSTTGLKTAGATTRILKIVGPGSIAWPNGIEEEFNGTEWRIIAPASQFTIV